MGLSLYAFVVGAIAGAVGAWMAFSLLIGGGFDWRLIVYMGVVFEYYYLAAAAGIGIAVGESRRARARPA